MKSDKSGAKAPGTSVQALGQTDLLTSVPKPLQAYLQTTLGQIEAITNEPDKLWAAGERGLQMETAGKILAGRAFTELREQLPPRDFSAGLAERHVARSSAYNAIDAWDMFAALPDIGSVQALAQIGVTKALALRHLTPAEHKALAAGEEVRGLTYGELVEMSSRDLQQHQRDWQIEHDDKIQKLEREKAQLKNQLDIVTNQKNLMARAGAALQAEEDLPHFALVVRQESMALTEQISFCLDNLQAVTDEHLFTESKHPEAPRFQPIAANTCYFAVAGVVARGLALLDKLRGIYGEDIGEQLTLEHQFSAIELKRFVEAREQILAAHQTAAKRRDDDRENNKPGKRGAKRKGGAA